MNIEEVKATRKRGINFSTQELVQLSISWLTVSQDPSAGSDQKADTFWTRISSHFNDGMGAGAELRSWGSLQTRWSTLQANVSKFVGIMRAIKSENHSGWSPEDELKEAMSRFKEVRNTCFSDLASYEILKGLPKFKAPMASRDSAAIRIDADADGEDAKGAEDYVSPLRPQGAKKYKAEVLIAIQKAKLAEAKTIRLAEKDVLALERYARTKLFMETFEKNLLVKNSLFEDQMALALFSKNPDSDDAKEFFDLKKKEFLTKARAGDNDKAQLN